MEIFALVTGVIYLVLEIRQRNFMWVVGVITSLAAMYMFFKQGLYASFGLNVYYFIISFWGLFQWSRDSRTLNSSIGRTDAATIATETMPRAAVDPVDLAAESAAESAEKVVKAAAAPGVTQTPTERRGDRIHLHRLDLKTVAILCLAFVVALALLRVILNALNDPMSGLDAAVAVLSAVATYMLSRSYIQQWLVWIVADLLSTILCATQGLYWMTALYAAYTISAVYGFYYWKRKGIYIDD